MAASSSVADAGGKGGDRAGQVGWEEEGRDQGGREKRRGEEGKGD